MREDLLSHSIAIISDYRRACTAPLEPDVPPWSSHLTDTIRRRCIVAMYLGLMSIGMIWNKNSYASWGRHISKQVKRSQLSRNPIIVPQSYLFPVFWMRNNVGRRIQNDEIHKTRFFIAARFQYLCRRPYFLNITYNTYRIMYSGAVTCCSSLLHET
jgi:hypothetical protein